MVNLFIDNVRAASKTAAWRYTVTLIGRQMVLLSTFSLAKIICETLNSAANFSFASPRHQITVIDTGLSSAKGFLPRKTTLLESV